MKLGYLKITVAKEFKNLAMNSILVNQLSYKKIEFTADGSIQLTVKASMEKDFKLAFESEEILASFGKIEGIGAYLLNYKCRVGMMIGILMVVFSVYFSSLFVWRIEIQGNETISKEEILDTLEKSDFFIGAFIPKIAPKIHPTIIAK